jgi:phage repressor protein C with HTH and peptisase S24 domain
MMLVADPSNLLDHLPMNTGPRDIDETKARRRRRLTLLVDEIGQAELARAAEISPAYLFQMSKAEGKQGRGVSDANARKLEAAAKRPLGWLDSDGDGSDAADMQEIPSHAVARFETVEGYVRFPLMEGFAGMGQGDYVVDYPEVVESLRVSRDWVERKLPGVPPEVIRVITGRGDSMKGQYNDGDLIFLDTRIKTFDQDSAYCFRWEGRVLVKRLQFVGRGTLRILSKNPDYPAIDAPLEDIEIGGRALAAWTLKEF